MNRKELLDSIIRMLEMCGDRELGIIYFFVLPLVPRPKEGDDLYE